MFNLSFFVMFIVCLIISRVNQLTIKFNVLWCKEWRRKSWTNCSKSKMEANSVIVVSVRFRRTYWVGYRWRSWWASKTVCKSWSAQLIGNPYHVDVHAKFPTGSKQPMLLSGYQEIVGIGSPSIPSAQLPITVLLAKRELYLLIDGTTAPTAVPNRMVESGVLNAPRIQSRNSNSEGSKSVEFCMLCPVTVSTSVMPQLRKFCG